MDVHLCRTIVFAKDMRLMMAFYRDVLGFEELQTKDSGSDWGVLKAGAMELALHGIPEVYAEGIEIQDPPEPRSNAVTKLVFRTDDLEAARTALRDQGAIEVHESFLNTDEEPVRRDFLDPEGNVFQLSVY